MSCGKQHRWHISLEKNGRGDKLYQNERMCSRIFSPEMSTFSRCFLLIEWKGKLQGISPYCVLTESVKSYEVLTKRTTQNKFNKKHRLQGKPFVMFSKAWPLLNVTFRKILYGGNVTLWGFRWSLFYFNECHIEGNVQYNRVSPNCIVGISCSYSGFSALILWEMHF